MPCGDVLFAHAAITEDLERTELIERMQADAFVVFRKRVVFGNTAVPDHAGDRLRLRHALLLHQKLEGAVSTPARRHLEHAGLRAVGVDDGTDAEALQQGALRDALGQLLDRDARLDAANIRLAQDQLVERNVPGRTEFDLLNGGCHVGFSATGGRKTLSRPPTRHELHRPPLTL